MSRTGESHETRRRLLRAPRTPDKFKLDDKVAQQLNNLDRITRDTVAYHARNELMKECLRRAEEIRRGLEGREHTNSTILIAEDRTRRLFT